jgi:hypothetical protein
VIVNKTEVEEISEPRVSYRGPAGYRYETNIPSIRINGVWDRKIAALMKRRKFEGLYFNYTRGWQGNDFQFLEELDGLRLLNIISIPVDTLSVIDQLTELESLGISCHWKKSINLSKLENLKSCYISWDKGAESVLQCDALQYLYIDMFKLKDYSAFLGLRNIRTLTIANSSFADLAVLANMKNIKKLELTNCKKLESLKGLEQLQSLEWLSIDGCGKINAIGEIAELPNLRILQFRDTKELASIKPISKLRQLQVLSFYGSTNIVDGDLSSMEALDQLSLVGYHNRRHYSHNPLHKWDWKDFGTPRTVVQKKAQKNKKS